MMQVGPQTVVVITGASGGVGRSTARLIAKRRAKLILLARGKDGLEAVKREAELLGAQALAIPTDVARFEEVEAAAREGQSQFGPVDLWINNAMVSTYSPFMRMSVDEFRHIIEVTFLGAVHGTRCALDTMIPRDRGVIVQVGSALAFRSIPLQSAYCASKHAIKGFTESLRSELIHQRSKVELCLVNLPALNTTQFSWTRNRMHRKARPVGTIYQPEVAADAILFATEHERCRMMVGLTTVEAVVGEKVIPGILDHHLAKAAWDGALLNELNEPGRPDNFWMPLAGDHGSHGEFDREARRFSPQLWVSKHRVALGGAILAVAGAAMLARTNDSRTRP